MINFDSIMNIAKDQAFYNAAQRITENSQDSRLPKLEPEMQELVDQNRINIILIEEMVKAALMQYHKTLEQEERRASRTKL